MWFFGLGCIAAFLCSSTVAQKIINHDQVLPFPEKVANGHEVLLKFKPFLGAIEGCDPFPAVNIQGDVSGGLKPGGFFFDDGCDATQTKGQLYGRLGFIGQHFGLMYGWYFPKNQGSLTGHRHEWLFVVVWLQSLFDPTAIHLSYTTDGKWSEDSKWYDWHGRPLLGKSYDGLDTGGSQPDLHPPKERIWTKSGPVDRIYNDPPLIDWTELSGGAISSLNHHSWGSGGMVQMRMNDDNFASEMRLAYEKAFGTTPNLASTSFHPRK